MKKIIALITGLAIAAVCFAQSDPVDGYWISIDEKTNKITAGWHVYQEGGILYGKILSISTEQPGVKAYNCKDSYPNFPVAGKISQMTVTNTPWIYGLTKQKHGEWGGGRIVNPEDGKDYICKIFFRAADGKKYKVDTLEMRGEIGLGIGRSQFWQKSDFQTANNLWPK